MSDLQFANRMAHVPKSFLREIFAIISDPTIISFAGGLPNPALFPVDAFKQATETVLSETPRTALQYANSEGYLPLRTYIADSYKKKEGIDAKEEQILITNGSQQALDLLGKVLVNPGDRVVVENPTYLAALQSLSLYGPEFVPLTLESDGPNIAELEGLFASGAPKMLYAIPNFQNPTGGTWSDEKRAAVGQLLSGTSTLFVEDDPYGEIRWHGVRPQTTAHTMDNAVLLGSFSKTVAPGLRLGWLYTTDSALYDKLLIAKQASDLHTSTFTQQVLHAYLSQGSSDAHIATIAGAYHAQKDAMVAALHTYIPEVVHTDPDGGMFLWLTFPETVDTLQLFDYAVKEGVAFVPGVVFYADQSRAPKNTARVNFTCASAAEIEEGMRRLARAITALAAGTSSTR